MKLLLDTCTFFWMILSPERLSIAARAAVSDPGNVLVLSVVSSWEIAMKVAAGGLSLSEPVERYVPYWRSKLGVHSLALSESSALYIGELPKIHRDPFDRMLVCQAIVHGLTLVTPDEQIRKYQAAVLW